MTDTQQPAAPAATAPAAPQPPAPPQASPQPQAPAAPELKFASVQDILSTPEGRGIAAFLGLQQAAAGAVQPPPPAAPQGGLSKADLEAQQAQTQAAIAKAQELEAKLQAYQIGETIRQNIGGRKFASAETEKLFLDYVRNNFKDEGGIIKDATGRAVQVDGRFGTMADVVNSLAAGPLSALFERTTGPAHVQVGGNTIPSGGKISFTHEQIKANPKISAAAMQAGVLGDLMAGRPISVDHPAIRQALGQA